jgi:kynurenine formamidase
MKLFSSVLFSGMLLLCGCTQKNSMQLSDVLKEGKWIDLTYAFSEETLYWPNNATGFMLKTQFDGITEGGFYYSSFAFCAPEHGGTHLDAPVHFAEGKQAADQVPLENLAGHAVVIDVSEKALQNPDYLITTADVLNWEKQHGRIPDASIILFRTGYGQFYPDAKKYFGTDERGAEAVSKLHFPGLHPHLAGWLVKERKPRSVGLDTPSIDYGQSKDFQTHRILMAENIPAFENVANLNMLPASGAYVIALPMKIKNGSGGPLRIIAWVKDKTP